MKKGFVVSAVLYPLLALFIVMIMSIIAMGTNRRKILDNMKLEVVGESETDPEMSNSALYYKMQALEEAYAELATRVSEERLEEIQADYENKIDISKNKIKLEIFPVGSIYISTTSTNPSNYIGGTWESYGEGRTLIGVGSGTDINSFVKDFKVETSGGEYNHTLVTSEMPSHTHIQSAHNHIQSAHGHTGNGWNYSVFQGTRSTETVGSIAGTGFKISQVPESGSWGSYATTPTATAINNATTAINQNTGGGQEHNNIQPYIVVYFWKRTA